MSTVRQMAQVTIEDLSDGAVVDLSTYTLVFAADKDAKAIAGSNAFVISTRIGPTQVDCTVDEQNITKPSAGVTVSVTKASGSMSPTVTITVTTALTQTVLNGGSMVTIPVQFSYQGETVTQVKSISIALARTGATGATGYNYFLSLSADAIVRAENGTLSASSVVASTTRGTSGNPSAYSAWYWIHKTTDGSTWTQVSKSSAAEASKTITVPTDSDVIALRVSAHTASPTDANKVDSQTIPIIDAGATGPQGEPAYTVLLTNESHTFAAGSDDKAIASSVETKVVAYKGATQVVATIGTITGTISGKLAATIKSGTNTTLNATVMIAATATLDQRQGIISIPVTVDGKSFTKQFSWSLSPKGDTGDQGPQGDPGEDGLSMSITSDNGTVLRNSTGNTTLTAHVWQTGQEVTGTDLAALGAIKWYKDGGTTAVATGATITVSAGDVTKKAVYTARLEA